MRDDEGWFILCRSISSKPATMVHKALAAALLLLCIVAGELSLLAQSLVVQFDVSKPALCFLLGLKRA